MKRRLFAAFALLVAAACSDSPTQRAIQSEKDGIAAAPGATANHVEGSLPGRKIFGFNDATEDNGFPFNAYGNGWTNNPTCEDLGLVGIKIDQGGGLNVNGTWPVSVTVGGVPTLVGNVTVAGDGTTWDWTSTFGVDAVISKGGIEDDGGHIYVYNPDAVGDNGLFSGMNKTGTARQAISHINFCFDLDPEAGIATDPYARRTYDWAVDKSTAQGNMTLNKNASATVTYSIVATPSGPTESDWRLDGQIKLRNDFAFAIPFVDALLLVNGDAVALSCPTNLIPAGSATAPGVVNCTFTTPLADATGGSVDFTAETVAPEVNDFAVEALYTFAPGDFELFNTTATVQDIFNGGTPHTFPVVTNLTGPTTHTYTATIPASAVCDITTIVNAAVLSTSATGSQGGTGTALTRRDEVSFDKKVIGCIGVDVTADPTFDRTYTWTIAKTASTNTVTTSSGQQPFDVSYTVTVTPTFVDGNFAVTGTVSVKNEALYPTAINVTGAPSPCSVTSPVLAAGATWTCSYSLAPSTGAAGTVSASATVETSAAVTDAASYAFTNPTNTFGGQVSVTDNFNGTLSTLGTADRALKSWTYTHAFGGVTCGTTNYTNTASFSSTSGQSGSASQTVAHTITGCTTNSGCTLTQGYWKTHSTDGPAAHPDAAWTFIPGGLAQNTIFYLSQQTWLQVFNTSVQGNQYYALAHQFMAATLNRLNGASAPADVVTALTDAAAFFAANVPVPASGKYKGKDAAQLAAMAALLDAYNNGVGPGHCDENRP